MSDESTKTSRNDGFAVAITPTLIAVGGFMIYVSMTREVPDGLEGVASGFPVSQLFIGVLLTVVSLSMFVVQVRHRTVAHLAHMLLAFVVAASALLFGLLLAKLILPLIGNWLVMFLPAAALIASPATLYPYCQRTQD